MSDREELAREIGRDLPDWTTVDGAFGINLPALADAVWAEGWRKKPERAVLWRTILDGMEDWREMSTTQFAEGITDAVLALLDGPTENGASQ